MKRAFVQIVGMLITLVVIGILVYMMLGVYFGGGKAASSKEAQDITEKDIDERPVANTGTIERARKKINAINKKIEQQNKELDNMLR